MKAPFKNLSTFQIVGFIFSAIMPLVIFVLTEKKEPVASLFLGFLLAVLTQGFDIQKRISDLEERLLKANALSQDLYQGGFLLKHIPQIVSDYRTIQDKSIDLFKEWADSAITQCSTVLHEMNEGYLIDQNGRTGTGKEETLKKVVKRGGTVKAVAALDAPYWRSPEAAHWVKENADAVGRGVKITRIFSYPEETLRGLVDVMEKQQSLGIHVYVAPVDKVDQKLIADYILFDDRVIHTIEGVGQINRISIIKDKLKVIKQFDNLLRYAKTLEEFVDE